MMDFIICLFFSCFSTPEWWKDLLWSSTSIYFIPLWWSS